MNTTLRISTVPAFTIASLFLAALVLVMPLNASAATYAYVNTSGTLTYIEASSSDDALNRATNRQTGSGVMLVSAVPVIVTPSVPLSGYAYVNTAGQVIRVSAATAAEAFAMAQNIAPHSGVMAIDTASDAEVVGDRVSGS